MNIEFFLLVIGLTMLWGGAELLVKYASRLAQLLGVSPIVLGLTVVSLGTSLPELVISTMAAWQGDIGISIGNIVGSNIANLALILGIGALIVPLKIKTSWVKREVPYMLFVTVVFCLFAYTGLVITLLEGVFLLTLLGLFLAYVGRFTLREMNDFRELQEASESEDAAVSMGQRLLYLLLSFAGIAILIGGSKLSVDSGTALAQTLGVSDTMIGLTLIALGTSLPELATTIVSASRKAVDLAVGNVIGSNIFNLALIGGTTALIRPIPVGGADNLMTIEFPILLIVSIVVWPMMIFRLNIDRYEGVLLLLTYIIFISLTILK